MSRTSRTSKTTLSILLCILNFIIGCITKEEKKYSNTEYSASIIISNYSNRKECLREAFVEIFVLLKMEEKNYSADEFHCIIGNYTPVGFFLTGSDSLRILNNPLIREGFFRNVDIAKDSVVAKWYIDMNLCPKEEISCELIGFSLYEIDSLVKPMIKSFRSLKYLDVTNAYKEVQNLRFQYYYFFDGLEVSKDSKEFFQKMVIDPPRVKVFSRNFRQASS